MEERQRVKIVDYVGSKKVETSKIDEKLKEDNAQIRLDTFIDPGLIRKVEGIVRDMMKEKGFQSAEVTHEIKEVSGRTQARARHLQHERRAEGQDPRIEFTGNKAVSPTARSSKQMKENQRARGFLSLHHRRAAPTRRTSSRRTPSA